ncbi:MAG: hypothetical protein AMJ43_01980 [Coxiella sp. DG_40]|nr:MAG: hypothetical protein AMJ43_01980 [Coxiella sp. DG_40]
MKKITLNTRRLYVKNASYEMSNAPQSFREQKGRPKNSIEMRINNNQLEEKNYYEAILSLTVTTKISDKILCTTKAEQAGIFKIENATKEQLKQILEVHCPHVLYPYACNVISQLTVMGSLPAIVLQPIDFARLYQQQGKKEQKQ